MTIHLLDMRRRIVHSATSRIGDAISANDIDCGQRFNNPAELRLVKDVPTCLWCAAGTFRR